MTRESHSCIYFVHVSGNRTWALLLTTAVCLVTGLSVPRLGYQIWQSWRDVVLGIIHDLQIGESYPATRGTSPSWLEAPYCVRIYGKAGTNGLGFWLVEANPIWTLSCRETFPRINSSRNLNEHGRASFLSSTSKWEYTCSNRGCSAGSSYQKTQLAALTPRPTKT